MDKLERKIGYTFKDKNLLKQALSHRSFDKQNNERLEFLGDSILNFLIAEALYNRFPTAVEGELSRLRASLVRGETLSKIAVNLDIGPHLLLGAGEMRSGGENRSSILADGLEAIIAAIYIDSDLTHCRARLYEWFADYLAQTSLDAVSKDPKSQLQELLQSKQEPLPEYTLVSTTGKEHAQIFTVACRVTFLKEPVLGQSTSRRKAEQAAATNTLTELKKYE